MSWFVDSNLTWIQRICVNIIKTGHVPKHIAFIMDGNRRYAKKTNLQKIEGHSKGFDKLMETISCCKVLGINEMTVYAFSIENFNRSKEEVDGFMELASQKFERLLEEKDKMMENGICIRIIGNLSYLSPKLRKRFAELILLTESNTIFFLNIAFSYSPRDEITNSIKSIIEGVNSGLLEVNDIDEQLISHCLYTNKSPDPDLLVRTSGETRFSDFLLWQISCTQVYFTDVLWPDWSLPWNLLAVVFKYQTNYYNMLSVKKTKASINDQCAQNNNRVEIFLKHLNYLRRNQLKCYVQV